MAFKGASASFPCWFRDEWDIRLDEIIFRGRDFDAAAGIIANSHWVAGKLSLRERRQKN